MGSYSGHGGHSYSCVLCKAKSSSSSSPLYTVCCRVHSVGISEYQSVTTRTCQRPRPRPETKTETKTKINPNLNLNIPRRPTVCPTYQPQQRSIGVQDRRSTYSIFETLWVPNFALSIYLFDLWNPCNCFALTQCYLF